MKFVKLRNVITKRLILLSVRLYKCMFFYESDEDLWFYDPRHLRGLVLYSVRVLWHKK